MPPVYVEKDAHGSAWSRYLICLALGNGSAFEAKEIAELRCKSQPQIAKMLELQTKAAIGAGSTTGSHWGDDLAPYGIGQEAFTQLQSASIALKVGARARRVEFHTKYPRETAAGAGGAWRGEGLPRPIRQSTTDTMTMEHSVADTAVCVTREVMRFGAVSEAALRQMVLNGVARFIDGQMLDASVSASTNLRPAALTNGAAVITSAGATAANVITDLTALIAAIATPGDSLVWVMRPLTYAAINAKLAGVGYPSTPGFLLGIPVITGSSSPQQITLIDCASIAFAADDQMAFEVFTQGDVQMNDSPTQDGTAGTGSAMVSLFQNGLVAVKASLDVTWQPIFDPIGSPTQPAGVAYCVVTY